MNKYKEKVLKEITNRMVKDPFTENVDILVNSFVKVYNLPDELIIYNDGDHIPRID